MLDNQKKELNTLAKILFDASTLKKSLNSIPLNIKTNSEGGEYINANIIYPHFFAIKEMVNSFDKNVKELTFEIPYFDEGNTCSKSAIINAIDAGVYNVAALCYNKAIITTYNQMSQNHGVALASIAMSHAENNFDKSYLFDQNSEL